MAYLVMAGGGTGGESQRNGGVMAKPGWPAESSAKAGESAGSGMAWRRRVWRRLTASESALLWRRRIERNDISVKAWRDAIYQLASRRKPATSMVKAMKAAKAESVSRSRLRREKAGENQRRRQWRIRRLSRRKLA